MGHSSSQAMSTTAIFYLSYVTQSLDQAMYNITLFPSLLFSFSPPPILKTLLHKAPPSLPPSGWSHWHHPSDLILPSPSIPLLIHFLDIQPFSGRPHPIILLTILSLPDFLICISYSLHCCIHKLSSQGTQLLCSPTLPLFSFYLGTLIMQPHVGGIECFIYGMGCNWI